MAGSDTLIPISALFFDDAGPHVVRAGFPTRVQATPGKPAFTPARGQELRELLDTSIAQLGAVSGEARRRTPPAPLPPPVAIESLLYRGRAALDRAVELRGEIVKSGDAPHAAAIAELLDLIALAATDQA